ncbi:MAG: hypothetical protein EOP04_00015 [Proteobacteria bacterium]|nr:MAG: hypothetical protein EOP04_00015 [Pseudomonadota bacterium]
MPFANGDPSRRALFTGMIIVLAGLLAFVIFNLNRKTVLVSINPYKPADGKLYRYMTFAYDLGVHNPCTPLIKGWKRCICYSSSPFSSKAEVSSVAGCDTEPKDCSKRIKGFCKDNVFQSNANSRNSLYPFRAKFNEIPVGSEAEVTLEESGIERLEQIYFKGEPVLKAPSR